MGRARMGQALIGSLGPNLPGPHGPPWALMGQVLMPPLHFHWCKFLRGCN